MVGSSKKMVSLNAERKMLRWQCAHQVKLREKSVGLFANFAGLPNKASFTNFFTPVRAHLFVA